MLEKNSLPLWKRIINLIARLVTRDSRYRDDSLIIFEPKEEQEPEDFRENAKPSNHYGLYKD